MSFMLVARQYKDGTISMRYFSGQGDLHGPYHRHLCD